MKRIIDMDKKTLKIIGFSYLMEHFDVQTPFGKEQKNQILKNAPKTSELLIEELNNVSIAFNYLKENSKIFNKSISILSQFKDIRSSLHRLESNISLDEVEFFEIKNYILLIQDLMNELEKNPLLKKKVVFNSLDNIFKILDPNNFKMPSFQIYSSYSLNLTKIRENKQKIEAQIYIEQDSLILDELKAKRQIIVLEERNEEKIICKDLSEKILPYYNNILDNIDSIIYLDLIIAKARLAYKFKGIKPRISDSKNIEFVNMTNPQISQLLFENNKKFTPISLSARDGVTIITGANMGGKSVSLQTIVLNALLGQLGFFIYAESSDLPFLDSIFYISEDMQNVSQGLSTFGAEIVNFSHILNLIKGKYCLIVLDEFARGTNPVEGKILVQSLAKFMNTQKAITFITTHYEGVIDSDMTHYQVIGLKNVDMSALKEKFFQKSSNNISSVQVIQDFMDYRLEKVDFNYKIPNDALNIAILLGFDQNIIEIAKKLYNESDIK